MKSSEWQNEVGHESCDDSNLEPCLRAVFGLALDGDDAIVTGRPFRAVQ